MEGTAGGEWADASRRKLEDAVARTEEDLAAEAGKKPSPSARPPPPEEPAQVG